jgi:hypothetical protein
MNETLYSLLKEETSHLRDEMATIDKEILALQHRKSRLWDRVKAAEVFMANGQNEPKAKAAEKPKQSVREAIAALMEDGDSRKPNHIRKALRDKGFDESRIGTKTGNFYTSLKRLTDDGVLIRESGWYRLVDTAPPRQLALQEAA